jgi:hypothetical protein
VMSSTLETGIRLTANSGAVDGSLSLPTAGMSNDVPGFDGYQALNRLYEQNARTNWFANYIEKEVDPNKEIKIGL